MNRVKYLSHFLGFLLVELQLFHERWLQCGLVTAAPSAILLQKIHLSLQFKRTWDERDAMSISLFTWFYFAFKKNTKNKDIYTHPAQTWSLWMHAHLALSFSSSSLRGQWSSLATSWGLRIRPWKVTRKINATQMTSGHTIWDCQQLMPISGEWLLQLLCEIYQVKKKVRLIATKYEWY